jgi:hypothetical protein
MIAFGSGSKLDPDGIRIGKSGIRQTLVKIKKLIIAYLVSGHQRSRLRAMQRVLVIFETIKSAVLVRRMSSGRRL